MYREDDNPAPLGEWHRDAQRSNSPGIAAPEGGGGGHREDRAFGALVS